MTTRDLPPLNWLRSFEAAARLLSFTGAGEELHITQSAVSQQVKLLEHFLGQPLFLRRPRSLQLTDAARNYLPTVNQAFRVLRDGTGEFLTRREGASLEVKANTAFSVFWLMPRLGEFMTLNPDVRVHVSTALWSSDFAGANAGVEIRYGRGEWEGVDGVCLRREDVYPVCAPAVGQRMAKPEDLNHETLLHLPHLADGWEFWARNTGVSHPAITDGHFFDTFVLAYDMARRGYGIAIGHDTLCMDLIKSGELVRPFDMTVPAQDNYYIVLPRGDESSDEALAFRDWVLTEFTE